MATHHLKKEFNNFNWDLLLHGEYATNGKTTDGRSYGFGEGGTGYIGGSNYIISIFNGDGREETWELPDVLHRYIKWQIDYAKKEKADEIKAALNIS